MNVLEPGHEDAPPMEGRPLPAPDNTSTEYWAAAARGDLVIQRCDACGEAQFYPRPMCIRCAGDVSWEVASGEGTVHTFTVIRQNLADPFRGLGAYVVAMVELAEGPRMMTNVTHVDPADVRVGLPVVAYAIGVREDLAIPFWRPA